MWITNKRLAVLLAAAALSAGCAFSGMFAGRNALEFYQGGAAGPEIHPVDGGYALKASLHNHTTWSHGALSAEELARTAASRGLAVLAVTEHDRLEACYGKKLVCFRDPSVSRMGYASYLEQMQNLQKVHPDLVILPGLEVAPYYWWSGVPPFLRLHGWDVHFTVYDPGDAETCSGLPVRGNPGPARGRGRDRGEAPYQDFVTYVAEHHGMVFLAHPESRGIHQFGTARTASEPHPEYVEELVGLTGFAALAAGRETLIRPGGTWDRTLAEYLAGTRPRPVWVLGDADFHGDDQQLDRVLTWIYAAALDPAAVLAAMRQGRMVAVQGSELEGLWVKEFALVGPGAAAGGRVMLGESSHDPEARIIRFALSREAPGMTARLIRNGEVIFSASAPSWIFDDSVFLQKRMAASYRVEVQGEGNFILVTNPIFYQPETELGQAPPPHSVP